MGKAEAYDRHTGRYAAELAGAFARFAGVVPGMRVLDVGCGPGGLATELARITGPGQVAGMDPSEDLVDACRARVPGADVRLGSAEEIPFTDESFDAVLAQLVVQVLDDAPRAVAEMRRVARPDGTVATCVWDFRDGMPLLMAFWGAAEAVDPVGAGEARGDDSDPWCTAPGLRELWEGAGLSDVELATLTAAAEYADLDDAWWSFEAGISPSGRYCLSLDEERRQAVRAEFGRRLGAPDGRFTLTGRAHAVRGRR